MPTLRAGLPNGTTTVRRTLGPRWPSPGTESIPNKYRCQCGARQPIGRTSFKWTRQRTDHHRKISSNSPGGVPSLVRKKNDRPSRTGPIGRGARSKGLSFCRVCDRSSVSCPQSLHVASRWRSHATQTATDGVSLVQVNRAVAAWQLRKYRVAATERMEVPAPDDRTETGSHARGRRFKTSAAHQTRIPGSNQHLLTDLLGFMQHAVAVTQRFRG